MRRQRAQRRGLHRTRRPNRARARPPPPVAIAAAPPPTAPATRNPRRARRGSQALRIVGISRRAGAASRAIRADRARRRRKECDARTRRGWSGPAPRSSLSPVAEARGRNLQTVEPAAWRGEDISGENLQGQLLYGGFFRIGDGRVIRQT